MATDRTQNHRPLRGGIAVWPSTGPGARGTLTAVARRVGFDTKVLVTNIHVVSTSADNYTLTEGEYLYQGGTAQSDRIGKTFTYTDGTNSWLPVVSSGRHQDGQQYRNPGDITLLDVSNGVTTDLGLHVDDGSGGHEQRPIVYPPVEPLPNMRVQVFGSVTGPGEARITFVDGEDEARRISVKNSETGEKIYYRFKETVILSRVPHPGQKGDSGAPCVWEDEDGNYRLVCILFAGIETKKPGTEEFESLTGYAMPARLAESLLGITFGVQAPTAEAGDPITVNAGERFTLDGRASMVNEPNAGPLEYSWERYISTPRPTGPLVAPQVFTTEQTKEFTAPPVPGEAYLYQLTVKDANGAKHSDLVRVIVNTPPTANPGWNQAVPVDTPVTLAGGVEDSDPGHADEMDYEWSLVEGPSGAGGSRGSGTRSAVLPPSSRVVLTTPIENGEEVPNKRTFTPAAIGDYVFTLTVTDPGNLTHSARVTIHACDAVGTSQWYDTGRTRGSGSSKEKWQTRVHNGMTEWDWAPATETPPVPTPAQWSVRYRNNRIQVKIKELPATTPAISEVKAKLGISPLGTGLGSDTITVTRDIGTRLNRWVNVLTDADAQWQVGTWTAQIRFENTVGESDYSAGKTVVVTPPNNPPVAFAGYHQVARTNRRVNLTNASASDPDGADQEGLTYSWIRRSGPFVLLNNANSLSPWFMAPRTAGTLKFRLRVTDPQGARDSDDVTIRVFAGATSSWYDTREEDGCGPTKRKRQTRLFKGKIEKQWVSTPEEVIWTDWADTDETRNQDIGDWTDTDATRENPVTLVAEKEQTRTVTWEKEQERTNQCDQSETQWVLASRTETQWVPATTTTTPPDDDEEQEGTLPPKPTDDQWSVRRSTDGIYANLNELPDINPGITEVQVHMENGRPPNLTTVTDTISATVDNRYEQVLAESDAKWLTGVWLVQARFKNGRGYGPYSEVKRVSVYEWEPTGETRGRVDGEWKDTDDPHRENQTLQIIEKKQERLVTWEYEVEAVPNPDNLGNKWFLHRGVEERWVFVRQMGTPPPPPTETPPGQDPPPTQDPQPQPPPIQTPPSQDPPTPPPDPDPETEPEPEPEPEETWPDTWIDIRIVITSYSNWRDTTVTRYSLGDRERRQTRRGNRERVQRRTSSLGNTETRAIPHTPLIEQRWVSDPEPEVWGDWTDTGRTRDEGQFGIIEYEQQRTSNYGNTQTRWVER